MNKISIFELKNNPNLIELDFEKIPFKDREPKSFELTLENDKGNTLELDGLFKNLKIKNNLDLLELEDLNNFSFEDIDKEPTSLELTSEVEGDQTESSEFLLDYIERDTTSTSPKLLSSVCNQWLLDNKKNPTSKKLINVDSDIFKRFKNLCKDEPDNCDKFRRNPKINPITNKPINENSIVYKQLKEICKSDVLDNISELINYKTPGVDIQSDDTQSDTSSLCKKWKGAKNINPISKKTISVNGDVFKIFKNLCEDEPDNCDKFRRNSKINPVTNKPIKENNIIYKQLKEICKENHITNDVELQESKMCKKWKIDKNINPITNRKITSKSDVYNIYSSLCEDNLDYCDKYKKNRDKNPITKKIIKRGSDISNILEAICD